MTRVAREVGTEGNLGGRAQVRGVSGMWKDLTDNVNFMAANLTSQVRNIAQVATAVAQGDLGKKIDVDARGEILELKTTINTMVDTLSSFSSEVTRVAREVGSEGRLGGQARVEGVHGTWKRLTTNVNELARNLTTQVRAIAEVTSAVAQGDMSRQITVETHGEVSELKDNINLHGLQPPRDHPCEGLAGVQPDPSRRADAGPPRPGGGRRPDPARADAAGERAVRRVLPRRHRGRRRLDRPPGRPRPWARAHRRVRPAGRRPPRCPGYWPRAWSGRRRWRRSGCSWRSIPPDYIKITPGSGSGAGQHRHHPDPVRGQAARHHRAGVVLPLLRRPPGVLRPVRQHHRRRDQHDPRQLPYGGAAGRVPAAWRHSSRNAPTSCSASRPSSSAPTRSSRRRPRCWPPPRSTSRSSWRTCRTSCARR